MSHGPVGCELRRQVGAGDADDEAGGTGEQRQRVGERLIHRRVDMCGVQQDVDEGRGDDDEKDAGDNGPEAFPGGGLIHGNETERVICLHGRAAGP